MVGVGHETDLALAVLASDVRAATPSNAAEILVPDKTDITNQLSSMQSNMLTHLLNQSSKLQQRLQLALERMSRALLAPRQKLELLEQALRAYNPVAVLAKGYAIVHGPKGVVRSPAEVNIGDKLVLELSKGKLGVTTDDKQS